MTSLITVLVVTAAALLLAVAAIKTFRKTGGRAPLVEPAPAAPATPPIEQPARSTPARFPVIGRRQPCPCGATWPAGHVMAGRRKAVRSCCGQGLAVDPTHKGFPLPRHLVDAAVRRAKVNRAQVLTHRRSA